MNIIKSTHTISDRLSTSKFREKVFYLSEAYIHNQIFVRMETGIGKIEEFRIRYREDFDRIISIASIAIVNNCNIKCTVMVRR